MEEYSNILAINLMKEVKTTRRLKRKLPQDLPDRTVIYRTYATGHMLLDACINYQMYYAKRQLVIIPGMKNKKKCDNDSSRILLEKWKSILRISDVLFGADAPSAG